MSVIPEVILSRVLVQGIRAVRKDNRLLDALFRNLDQSTLQAIKDFINDESVHFSINYPRSDSLHTPTIALMLKNETEGNTFLGDIMGAAPHYDMPDQELAIDTLGGHGASTSGLHGLPKKYLGPLRIASAEYNSELDCTTVTLHSSHTEEITEFLQSPPHCADAYIVGGAGAGQTGTILAFNGISLDIDGRFDPQLDSSSLLDIRATNTTEVVGEPSRVYSASATNLLRKGANFSVQYQLAIIADHQDKVLYLYSIVKAILFSQKNFMEEQGLMALQVSGSDFAPRTDFLPSEVFQRVMILQFVYPFTFLEELEAFEEIRFDITPRDPNTGEVCSPISLSVTIGDEE